MATKINMEYCGMPGAGATVREAKQDAARKIESALSGTYTPRLIRHGDYSAFIWREPMGGWHYKIVDRDDDGHLYGAGGVTWTESDACTSCARHLAQNADSYAG